MYPLEFFFNRTESVKDDLALLIGRPRVQECVRIARARANSAIINSKLPDDVKLDFIQQATAVADFYEARLTDACYPNPPCPPLP